MKNKKIKVFVTGASGFIGLNLCLDLFENGYEVFGLYRKIDRDKIKRLKNINLIKGDLTKSRELFEILEKIRPAVIFHTAALHPSHPIDNFRELFDSNVKSTLNLLEASRILKINRFIHSSSMSVYGTPVKYLPVDEKHPLRPYDFYSYSKYLAEDLCNYYAKQFGLNLIILRYAGVYGSGRKWGAVVNFFNNARKNLPLIINNNINWDIVAIQDITEANLKAFEQSEDLKHEIINIGSGRETNILELARLIIRLTESKSGINKTSAFLPEPSSRFYYDITKAKKLLKFQPTSLLIGMTEYIKGGLM